jgi:hypothetical protein
MLSLLAGSDLKIFVLFYTDIDASSYVGSSEIVANELKNSHTISLRVITFTFLLCDNFDIIVRRMH